MNLTKFTNKRISKPLISGVILAFASAFNMSAAMAHAHIVNTIPAANTTVDSVEQVCIEFDSKLESAFSKLNLFNDQGQQVNMDESTFDKDDKQMCLVAPGLESGAYKAEWTAVARDGHHVKGDFNFTVK